METFKFEQTVLARGEVNKEMGQITGVSLISTPEAKGHNISLDRASIQSFFDAVQGKQIKAYYTHSPSNEALDSIGLWTDFEIIEDGEFTKLIANFQALDSWKQHHQDDFDALFELAVKAPEAFGVSAEFQAKTIYYKDDEETEYTGQEDVEVFARAVEVSAFSIVAQPAANPTGLFAAKEEKTNYEQVADTLIQLQEKNDELVMELKLEKDLTASLQKEKEQAAEEKQKLETQVQEWQAKFAQYVAYL
jgi:hypothetical protein